MDLGTLRARVREARRLIAQARQIARASFEHEAPPKRDLVDAPKNVGWLFDSVHRLLPGMAPFGGESPPPASASFAPLSRAPRGTDRPMDAMERDRLLSEISEDAADLLAEIERGSASSFRAAVDISDTGEHARLTRD
ncbi:MAG TPA: hypothetical protein VGI39_14290 [Polyangiaceae bacterium]